MDRPRRDAITLNEDENGFMTVWDRFSSRSVCGWPGRWPAGPLFGRKEFELRDQVHDLGARALEVAADERQKKGGGTKELAWSVRIGGRRAVRRAARQVVSEPAGVIRLTRRYYHCRDCRQGHVPWDQTLGLGMATLTPAASEVASIAGVQTSFAQSAEVTLQKLCGLRLSESTVERVTEAAGARLAQLQSQKLTFGECKPWGWQRDARQAARTWAWTPPACVNRANVRAKQKAAWPTWPRSITRAASTTAGGPSRIKSDF